LRLVTAIHGKLAILIIVPNRLLYLLDPISYPQFCAYLGCASALVFTNAGAAYGTAKSSIAIANLGVVDPNKIFRALIPIIMAGILGIYGLIVGVLMAAKADKCEMKEGYAYLGAGLACGLSSLASGLAIGIAGEAGVKAFA
jgi:V-type H+-transporting ATPase proteolipid subunit